MPVSEELIAILVCPETKQRLRLADGQMLLQFQKALDAGPLYNRARKAVGQSVAALLLREDGMVVYPVRNDIPILLIDEAIETSSFLSKTA